MKSVYSGLLGRKRTSTEFNLAFRDLLASGAVPQGGIWNALFDPGRREVRLLFEHHRVDPNAPDAWRQLSLALARSHVPYFQPAKARGRRPRLLGIETFFTGGDGTVSRRSRGAPRKGGAQKDAWLRSLRLYGKRLLRRQNRKVTDLAALTEALADLEMSKGMPAAKARNQAKVEAKRLAKRLPEAKRTAR